jgi:squalene-hopene/tetraprenyl-beta-curcumene cyclase
MRILKTPLASSLALTIALTVSAAAPEQTVSLVSSLQPAGTLHESLQREVDAAIDRSLDWLSERQKADGSWSKGDFPALTALPLWAFAQARHTRKSAAEDAAIRYILSCAHEDGGIYKKIPGTKGGGLSNYNTAICMTALHATGRADVRSTVLKARSFVAGSQYFGDDEYRGGFGYESSTKRAYTDLLNTYYASQAMRLTASEEEFRPKQEKRADIDWGETIKFVERMQNKPDSGHDNAGGFFYNPTDPKAGTATNASGDVVFRSYGSITYAGLLAMVFADISREDVRVRSTFDWAERNWTLDENPGMGQQGLYFFYHVLTRGLVKAGKELIAQADGTQLNWKEAVARKILSMQKIDPDTGHGFWVNESGRFWESDPVLATAYCLLALQAM